jgi:hypothetical protein
MPAGGPPPSCSAAARRAGREAARRRQRRPGWPERGETRFGWHKQARCGGEASRRPATDGRENTAAARMRRTLPAAERKASAARRVAVRFWSLGG